MTSVNELDAFPFHVEVWTDDDQHIGELLATSKNAAVAQAAYAAALKERPGKIVRLRIKARVIEEFIP